VYQVAIAEGEEVKRGTFVMPTLIELESFDELQREIFGPVLHVVRYNRKDLDQLIEQINASGYGLTLGVHTRIDETIAKVVGNVNAGNIYVNRNIVGAVVGVQPFGGEGLSGTGPKAGGPLYLYRLLSTRPADAIARHFQADDARSPADTTLRDQQIKPLNTLKTWAAGSQLSDLAALCEQFAGSRRAASPAYCLARPASATATACCRASTCCAWPTTKPTCWRNWRRCWRWVARRCSRTASRPRPCAAACRRSCKAKIKLVADWNNDDVAFDAVIHHGHRTSCAASASRWPSVPVRSLACMGCRAAITRLPWSAW
jgi:RHH-type proline utilization regulon transcriptional repressor/proline dehydrogenase/delta 1-pyrroline-5-carboxylate dehydrogenase